jgi:hypothetical protein
MIFIAHRGNINGPNEEQENQIEYIKNTIQKGFNVEIDLWKIKDDLFLGHDVPQYDVSFNFLNDNKNVLWCHCKNLDALIFCLNNNLRCFFHNVDDYTITSDGFIWCYPNKQTNEKCICVLPEWNNNKVDFTTIEGICTDYVIEFKELYHIFHF